MASVASTQYQFASFAGQRPCQRQPDPTTSACDESDFTAQPRRSPLLFCRGKFLAQCLDSVRPVADQREEFGARFLLVTETSKHGGGHGRRVLFLDTPHHHA